MKKEPIVGICTPSGEMVDADFTLSLAGMAALTVGYNPNLLREVAFRKRQATHRARNWLVRHMLTLPAPEVTHLLWLDDDHVFPAATLIRLLSHDKDIIGCLHRARRPPYHVIGSLLDPEPDFNLFTAGGIHRAVRLGGGLLMVKRHVYETMTDKGLAVGGWYREAFDPKLSGTDGMDPDNVDGDIGEDVYFCMQAKRAGFEIWCDLDLTYEVKHKNGSEAIDFRYPPPLPPYPIATQ